MRWGVGVVVKYKQRWSKLISIWLRRATVQAGIGEHFDSGHVKTYRLLLGTKIHHQKNIERLRQSGRSYAPGQGDLRCGSAALAFNNFVCNLLFLLVCFLSELDVNKRKRWRSFVSRSASRGYSMLNLDEKKIPKETYYLFALAASCGAAALKSELRPPGWTTTGYWEDVHWLQLLKPRSLWVGKGARGGC